MAATSDHQRTLFDEAAGQTCAYCAEPGEFLCDHVLSLDPFRTCDAPLCELHVQYMGPVFFDGDKAHTFIDSRDLCLEHAPAEAFQRAAEHQCSSVADSSP